MTGAPIKPIFQYNASTAAARQSGWIWILSHDLHGVRAVGLEDANRAGGSDPVAGVRDPFGSNRADARHLAKPIGLGLDDVLAGNV